MLAWLEGPHFYPFDRLPGVGSVTPEEMRTKALECEDIPRRTRDPGVRRMYEVLTVQWRTGRLDRQGQSSRKTASQGLSRSLPLSSKQIVVGCDGGRSR